MSKQWYFDVGHPMMPNNIGHHVAYVPVLLRLNQKITL